MGASSFDIPRPRLRPLQELGAGAPAAAFPVNVPRGGDRLLAASGGLGPIKFGEPLGIGVQVRRFRGAATVPPQPQELLEHLAHIGPT
jgi:hypothetical protein